MELKLEKANKPAITTKFIMGNSKEITYVKYDDEGDWQFLSGDIVSEADAMVVSIAEILQKDSSLLSLPDIAEDEVFTRLNKNSPWQKSKN